MQLDSAFFTNNRQKLIATLPKKGVVVVAGNGYVQRNADSTFPFRQDSNFWYLTGINEPCATLVIDTVHNTSWVMLPLRTGTKAIFDGHIDTNALAQASGLDEIVDETIGWQRIKASATTTTYVPAAPRARIDDMYTNPHRAAVAKRLQRYTKDVTDIRPNLTKLRAIKSPEEIAQITIAAKITLDAIARVEQTLDSLQTEQAVEMSLLQYFKTNGATGHAFTPIVASDDASCVLHYNANNQPIGDRVLLLDVGAEVQNYSADISRTLVLNAQPQYQKVHDAVLHAQQEIIRQTTIGMTWQEYAALADEEVGRQLVTLGYVAKGFTREQVRQYFPHAVGHFLGLDTHDAGDYSLPLAENMVITAEPGIYLPESGFGVRIEDDIVLTKKGAKVLGINS